MTACTSPVAQSSGGSPLKPGNEQRLSATPFQPLPTNSPTATPEAQGLWIDPAVPEALIADLTLPENMIIADSPEHAASRLEPSSDANAPIHWIYVLAAPFATIQDNVSLADLQAFWRGENVQPFGGAPMALSAATQHAFETQWGPADSDNLRVANDSTELAEIRDSEKAWALLPLEQLDPQWKVISIDGQNPLVRGLDAGAYPLAVSFTLTGLYSDEASQHPLTNRDETKLTVLVMTGVTALVRTTAAMMDAKGVDYPASSILDWLQNADLTHTSNEVSFTPDCPKAHFTDTSLQMCSQPDYINLLKDAGIDIIELSGNHLNDYGREPLTYTLDLYHKVGMRYFAGGSTLEEARQPLLVEDHGNRLAFIGCNPAGPDNDWATDSQPGAAPCDDYEWMKAKIRQLRSEGYLPIVTLQYFEAYRPNALDWEQRDFRALADAGAVIVSGSQAHYPMGLEFRDGGLIHYGLGNLFFDQMRYTLPNGEITDWTAREFVDRHIFYDGHYISTQLLTARLEDYSRPRPMTDEERAEMLGVIFSASGW
ncbi:bacterial capsule synthesis protein PGA_cap [Longilinea arvoryzae]|uniref:Bacterial capsule synthesis protein PGA_cap n=2 Tax=Longilinea arvoryzae TaxID=360412 RepID=A0A0S7BKI3_9CHLR|nr:bacterial capsule synthesis protein PGA_cap [Longilinea arvoryzae]